MNTCAPVSVGLLLSFNLCSAFILEPAGAGGSLQLSDGAGYTLQLPAEAGGSLQLPEEYHFKGDVTSLGYGSIQEFEIWYSAKENKSRKDTNGGLVRRYCSDEIWQYTVHPKSTKELENEMVCSKTPDGKLINFLPHKNFTFAGRASLNGRPVAVWNSSQVYGRGLRKAAALYVSRADGVDVPVLYELKEENLWSGVVSSYSVTRYYDYRQPTLADLVYDKEDDCAWGDQTDRDVMSQLEYVQPHFTSHAEEAFSRYKERHNKVYDEDEEETRKQIFTQNWRLVTEHNGKNLSFKMSLNKFSDRKRSELAHLTSTRPAPHLQSTEPLPLSARQLEQLADELPENYDMRTEGLISVIKNQGECGSCWAFSTAAAVEGALAKRNGGRDLDLSEQSLVDCSWGYDNTGCDGGFLPSTFQYVLANGIPTEKEYGLYTAEEGVCHLRNMTDVYRIKSFAAIPSLSVNATKAALYHFGPVVVTINTRTSFVHYSSGIFYDKKCNKGRINHAVTLVGYGVRDGAPFWIVKNSWGEDWGEDGYVLFSALDNNCHILEEPYCPLI